MEISQLCERYLALNPPSPSVRAALFTSWPKFLDFCEREGLTLVSAIKPAHVERLQTRLLWEPHADGKFYSRHSVDQFMRRVRQVLRWATAQGFIGHDPTHCLLLPRPPKQAQASLTLAEFSAVLAVPDRGQPVGLRDAVLLALLTETELGLLQSLTLAANHMPEGLEESSLTLLAQYLEKGRPSLARNETTTLLVNSHGERLSQQSAHQRLKFLGQQAGLDTLTARVLRRSYQEHLARLSQSRHFSFNRDPLTE